MKMTKMLPAAALVLHLAGAGAQDMPRTVIGAAGDYYQSIQAGNLHWTVGEIAVSRYQNGLELGEGFHRMYYDLLVEVDDALPLDWDVSVFPNPTVDRVRLQFPEDAVLRACLYQADGRPLMNLSDLRGITTLNLSQYPEGTYLLRLLDQYDRQRTVRIIKMRK